MLPPQGTWKRGMKDWKNLEWEGCCGTSLLDWDGKDAVERCFLDGDGKGCSQTLSPELGCKECCEMLSSGHNMALGVMSSQQQWLPTQDLHIIGPSIFCRGLGERLISPDPFPRHSPGEGGQ